jgi:hypothetical protein
MAAEDQPFPSPGKRPVSKPPATIGIGGWRRDFLTISSSKTPNEYIIRVLSFVGSRRTRGCRTLVPFKGAGFDFSAAPGFLSCAILCGAFTGAEPFIS